MTKSCIKIEPMQKDYLDDVMVVEEKAYGPHHWSKESFFNELNSELARYYCAFNEKGELTGYAGCWQVLEEAHITNIAVSPDFRRQHIAEALLTTIIESCRKAMVKYITLEVRVSNAPAIALYEKYGFKSLGVRKGYYQDNDEDALIMWTENIFYDKFKSIYEQNLKSLNEKAGITYKL